MVPLGGIIVWSGAIIDIPENWQLCDGTNSTPDLRDKFVPGAGDTYAVDELGGALTHINAEGQIVEVETGVGENVWGEGATGAGSSLPPFLSLAYIERMI